MQKFDSFTLCIVWRLRDPELISRCCLFDLLEFFVLCREEPSLGCEIIDSRLVDLFVKEVFPAQILGSREVVDPCLWSDHLTVVFLEWKRSPEQLEGSATISRQKAIESKGVYEGIILHTLSTDFELANSRCQGGVIISRFLKRLWNVGY